MTKNCSTCGKPILPARLEALPDTETCVKCSVVAYKPIEAVDLDGTATDELTRTLTGNDPTSHKESKDGTPKV